MEDRLDLAIVPKNSATDMSLFIFEFLFFSEEYKLALPLGQCADMAANKHRLTHGVKSGLFSLPNSVCRMNVVIVS